MGTTYSSVFSEFEINRLGIKVDGDAQFTAANCVATFKEEMETKTITKKCRGVVAKTTTKGTGNGTIESTLHIPYVLLVKLKGMQDSTLAEDVYGYGNTSRHKSFIATCKIEDEDGNVKLKAYPNCIVQNGIPNDIENESTEVKESELSIVVMPDSYGFGVYEKIVPTGTANADTIIENWMTNWSHALVASVSTNYDITWTLTGCTATNGASTAPSGSMLMTYINTNTGYTLPSTITVTGATEYLWNEDTGLLIVDNITANTSITITATT